MTRLLHVLSRGRRSAILTLLSVLAALLLPYQGARAATGVDWASLTTTSPAYAVAYGAGRFVATHQDAIMTSDDGVNWTARTAPVLVPANATDWRSVVYGNGLFVAVGSTVTASANTVMTSPDGITWTRRTASSQATWSSVTYGNGVFVAVAFGGLGGSVSRAMYSSDGITWTNGTGTGVNANAWRSVVYGNGIFVAVSNTGGTNQVMTSTDGQAWTLRAVPTAAQWWSVTYGNGLFVAVANQATSLVMTSPNGIDWTLRTAPSTSRWQSVTYGNGLFVAVAGTATAGGTKLMTSPDGINWTARTPPSTAPTYSSVAYGSGRFVAVASSAAVGMYSGTPCGDGLAYPTTGQWRQFALPCEPSASPADVANVLGNSPTANMPSASLGTDWYVFSRNATNSGNTQLFSSSTLANGAGHWFYSQAAPVGNSLNIVGTAATVTASIEGCQSLVGCVVLQVPTGTAGARMFGNPFGYDVAWSDVRFRIGGPTGTIYTPTQAFNAGFVSKQIWIWNGGSYDTWDDSTTPGNLKYSQGFFLRVLAGGVGQTIELLIPARSSSLTVTSLPGRIFEGVASVSRSALRAVLGIFVSTAHAQEPPKGWRVKLRVENAAKATKAQAVLGQFPGSVAGYDGADLSTLAPFAAPYLSLVFPHPEWMTNAGDYATDFRPFDGRPGTWQIEVRADAPGQQLVLRWEGDPAILRRSVLIDPIAGRTILPSNPRNASGYAMTLNTPTRRLTWRYLGR